MTLIRFAHAKWPIPSLGTMGFTLQNRTLTVGSVPLIAADTTRSVIVSGSPDSISTITPLPYSLEGRMHAVTVNSWNRVVEITQVLSFRSATIHVSCRRGVSG